jgi:hypothetical protein
MPSTPPHTHIQMQGQGYKLAMNYEGSPKYSFEYPAAWEEEPVSKTDKSTMVRGRRRAASLMGRGRRRQFGYLEGCET